MRKVKNYGIAFLTSAIMPLWYAVYLGLINDQMDPVSFKGTGLILLQVIMVIKSVCISIVVLPGDIKVKQLLAGWLTTDLLFAFTVHFSHFALLFSIAMLFSQGLILIVFVLLNKRQLKIVGSVTRAQMERNFIFQGI